MGDLTHFEVHERSTIWTCIKHVEIHTVARHVVNHCVSPASACQFCVEHQVRSLAHVHGTIDAPFLEDVLGPTFHQASDLEI